MIDNDIYRPPKADLEISPSTVEVTLKEPRKCPASAGGYWFKDAWHLFKIRPWLFIGMWLVFFFIAIVLSLIPIGSIVSTMLSLILGAGFIASAAKVEQGEPVGVGGIFAGFSNNFGKLCGVGGLYLLFIVLAMLIAAIPIVLSGGMSILFSGQFAVDNEVMFFPIILAVLIYLAILIPLAMLIFFAPALIIQHDVGVWQAMSLSFKGCIRNILPFLVYGLVAVGLAIIAALPLLLGLFIFFPVVMLTLYTAYKDIFLHVRLLSSNA